MALEIIGRQEMGEKAGFDFPPREEGDVHEEKPRPENDRSFLEMSHKKEQQHEGESAASNQQTDRYDGLCLECLGRFRRHSRWHEPGDNVFEFLNNKQSRQTFWGHGGRPSLLYTPSRVLRQRDAASISLRLHGHTRL